MMEDRIYYNELFDIYNSLLTENERKIFIDYYHEDMSLSEIADNYSISRSAVQKTLKTVVDKLLNYEQQLKINKKTKKIINLLKDNQELVNKVIQVMND